MREEKGEVREKEREVRVTWEGKKRRKTGRRGG